MNRIQRYSLPIFFIVVAAQWYVPISMIVGFENVLDVGTAFKFKAQPRDPFNPVYGNYMSINYEASSIVIPRNFELNQSDIAFFSVIEDETGYAIIHEISHKRPSTVTYFTAMINYIDYNYRTEPQQAEHLEEEEYAEPDSMRIDFDIPFTEFYLNQETAPIAEDIFNEGIRDSARVYGLVKIHNGQAVLEMLFIDDVPITELSRNRLIEMRRYNRNSED